MGHSSFTSKLVLKDMLNEDRVNGLFRVILNILFVTLFIEGVGAYLIYLDIKGGLPGGTLCFMPFRLSAMLGSRR